MGENHQGQGSVTALVDRLTHNAFFGEYEQRIIQVERNKEI